MYLIDLIRTSRAIAVGALPTASPVPVAERSQSESSASRRNDEVVGILALNDIKVANADAVEVGNRAVIADLTVI